MLIRFSSLCAVMSIVGAATQAQPAASIDCGNVAEVGAFLGAESRLVKGTATWFHIRLASPIAAARNWLEIDTAPSAIAHTVAAVYNAHGKRVGLAHDAGGGSGQQLGLDTIPGMPGGTGSPGSPGGHGLVSD